MSLSPFFSFLANLIGQGKVAETPVNIMDKWVHFLGKGTLVTPADFHTIKKLFELNFILFDCIREENRMQYDKVMLKSYQNCGL